MRITVVPAFPSAPVNIPHPKNWPLIEDDGAFALNLVHRRAALHRIWVEFTILLFGLMTCRGNRLIVSQFQLHQLASGNGNLADSRLREDDLAIVNFDPYSLAGRFIRQVHPAAHAFAGLGDFAFHLDRLARMASRVGHQVRNRYRVFRLDGLSEARFGTVEGDGNKEQAANDRHTP
jgi:hypothetical protein